MIACGRYCCADSADMGTVAKTLHCGRDAAPVTRCVSAACEDCNDERAVRLTTLTRWCSTATTDQSTACMLASAPMCGPPITRTAASAGFRPCSWAPTTNRDAANPANPPTSKAANLRLPWVAATCDAETLAGTNAAALERW